MYRKLIIRLYFCYYIRNKEGVEKMRLCDIVYYIPDMSDEEILQLAPLPKRRLALDFLTAQHTGELRKHKNFDFFMSNNMYDMYRFWMKSIGKGLEELKNGRDELTIYDGDLDESFLYEIPLVHHFCLEIKKKYVKVIPDILENIAHRQIDKRDYLEYDAFSDGIEWIREILEEEYQKRLTVISSIYDIIVDRFYIGGDCVDEGSVLGRVYNSDFPVLGNILKRNWYGEYIVQDNMKGFSISDMITYAPEIIYHVKEAVNAKKVIIGGRTRKLLKF